MTQSIDVMTLKNAIDGRCSVRSYTPERLDQKTLMELLACAVRAPTAMHGEPWKFVVVQDLQRLKRLSDLAKSALLSESRRLHPDHKNPDFLSHPDFNIFYDASTLLLVCAASDARFGQADCWLAAQNLMLAAYAMGLGTCVIGSALAMLNLPDIKAELGIPLDATAYVPLIVGRPRGATEPSARQAPHILAWR